MARKRNVPVPSPAVAEPVVVDTRKPLVFISHDTRDADIAEAFANLLTDASGGILQSFRSSDRKGVEGIEFGAEWYRTIMERIENATDVVALITEYSINRPWILYEAGVAKGKLDRVVFGLATGIPLTEASVGPFAQFQNSGDDEDSLTKLVLQLIRRNPDADPREEAVRRQVIAFRETVAKILQERPESVVNAPVDEENSTEEVAKLFEEVKAMFRELPERLDSTVRTQLRRGLDGRRAKVRAGMVETSFFSSESIPPRERVIGWLIAITPVQDEAPWLYDFLLDVQRAVRQNDAAAVKELARSLDQIIHTPQLDWMLHESLTRDHDNGLFRIIRHLPEMLERLAGELPPRKAVPRKHSSTVNSPLFSAEERK